MGEKNYPSEIFSDEAEEIKLKAGSESASEKNAHVLFEAFLNAETLKEKIDMLYKISEAGAVGEELLDWISNISPGQKHLQRSKTPHNTSTQKILVPL